MTDQDPKIRSDAPEEQNELDRSFESLSLDELLASVKDDLARVDAMMGDSGDTEAESRAQAEAELAGKTGETGETGEKKPGSGMQPLFEPKIPEEYADLTVDEEKPEQTPQEPEKRQPRLPSGIRVLLYVCCVLAVSVLLAVAAWRCADDVLSLTKDDTEVSVTVPDGATISQIAAELKGKNLVRYEWLFKAYCWISHAESKIEPGTYTLSGKYDYHALVANMIEASPDRAVVSVTIPEGYECKDIFALLDENGVCSYNALTETAATYEFDYEFLQDVAYGSENRLEGYLFPDTYEFYVGDDPENVIDKFLRNFNNKFTEDLYTALDELNVRLAEQMRANGFTEPEITAAKLSLNDLITVASLVEKETAKTSESASIASVIYNRLCSKLYPCLEIDATIQYALGERKEVLSNADKGVISPYNTYTNAGLPAGPIANPGMSSIRAALYPSETKYFFYALGADGVHHFSETYYEHQNFLDELAGKNAASDAGQTDAENADGAETADNADNTNDTEAADGQA